MQQEQEPKNILPLFLLAGGWERRMRSKSEPSPSTLGPKESPKAIFEGLSWFFFVFLKYLIFICFQNPLIHGFAHMRFSFSKAAFHEAGSLPRF